MSESNQHHSESQLEPDCHNENDDFQDFPDLQPQEVKNSEPIKDSVEIKEKNPVIQPEEQEKFEDIHERAEIIENKEQPVIPENPLKNEVEFTPEVKSAEQEVKEPIELIIEEKKEEELVQPSEVLQTAPVESKDNRNAIPIEVPHVEGVDVGILPEVIKGEPNILEASEIKITENLNEKFLESGPVLINSQEVILEDIDQKRPEAELLAKLTGEIPLENSVSPAHEPIIIESQYSHPEQSPEEKKVEPRNEAEPILIQGRNKDALSPKVSEEKKEESPKKGQLTKEERIEQAKEFKEQGNKFFKEKSFVDAINSYESALSICHPNFFINSTPSLIKEMITLTNILLNNLSYCYFNINDLGTSLKFAEQVLLTDPRNIKAQYRKAVAYKKLNDIERSFSSIKEARKICIETNDNNVPVFQEYEEIKKNYQDYIAANKEKEKALYSKMISSSKPENKQENNSDVKINEKLKQELKDDKEKEDDDSHQYLWVIPSSLAGMFISWYLKQNLKQGKGVLNTLLLVGFFSGTAVVNNTLAKGLLAISSLAFSAYLYKKSRM